MKLMKVFDCHKMPTRLRRKFFDNERNGLSRGNDCYIDWYVNSYPDPDPTIQAIDEWLIKQGAEPGVRGHEGEHVLISHWW